MAASWKVRKTYKMVKAGKTSKEINKALCECLRRHRAERQVTK